MDKLLSEKLGLDVTIANEPELCASKGACKALNKMHILDNFGYEFKTKEDVRIR